MFKFIFSLIVILMVFAPFAGAQEYILSKGDIVGISVWGEDDLSKEVVIAEDGTISFPLIGNVEASGLTLQQLDDRITELLEKDYLVKADVTVAIARQQFFITGEVKRPGAHPLSGKIGLLQAVTLAGGFTDFASSSVKIIRQIEGKEETTRVNVNSVTDKEGRVKDEYIIKPNDVIIVPRSIF